MAGVNHFQARLISSSVGAKACAFSDFLNRGHDLFVCMAQDHRSPRTDVIDVSVAVDVGDRGAAG